MTKEEFRNLSVGDIVSNKIARLDYNGNPSITGYDYVVTEIVANAIYFNPIIPGAKSYTINGKTSTNPSTYKVTMDEIESCAGLYVGEKQLHNVILFLNADGTKATGSKNKIIQVLVKDNVTDADIDKIFPINLVERYEINDNIPTKHFKVGDFCEVIDTVNNYIFVAKVSKVTNTFLHADLLYNITCNKLCYGNYGKKFNVQGISVGDGKRYMVSDVSEDKIKQYNDASELDKMYVTILELLGADVEAYKNSYDVMEPIKPDYLDIMAAKQILAILREAEDKNK